MTRRSMRNVWSSTLGHVPLVPATVAGSTAAAVPQLPNWPGRILPYFKFTIPPSLPRRGNRPSDSESLTDSSGAGSTGQQPVPQLTLAAPVTWSELDGWEYAGTH